MTELCHTIYNYNLPKIRKLIYKGKEINIYSDKYNCTPLIQAIDLNQAKTVRLLLKAGADVQLTFDDCTPLGLAVIRGNIEIVKLLLDAGANPSFGGDSPPLSSAISREDRQLFQILLDAGSNVNSADSSGITPLMRASLLGRLDFVQDLVNAGADVNYINRDGLIAVGQAAYNGHQEVFDYLFPLTTKSEWRDYALESLPSGIRRKQRKQNNLLRNFISAVTEGNIEAVRESITTGVDVNSFTEEGMTALHTAALIGHAEIVRVLLELEADPDILAEDDGWTPLMEAAQAGSANIVTLLVEAGANLENCIEDMTPLMLAADANRLEVTKILLKSGANINTKNLNGCTALFFAKQSGAYEIIQLLLEAGATED